MTLKFDEWPRKKCISSILRQALCILSNPLVNSNWSYSPKTHNSGQNWRFFVPCDFQIWWVTLENYRAPLLYYIKLWASFQIHRWIQTGVTFRKRSICVKIGIFLSRVTLKFDGWPWKTIGHLFYTTFKVCASFQSHRWNETGVTVPKCSILVKIGNFLSCVTLKFDRGPWKTIEHLTYAASHFVHHFIAIGEFNLKLQSGNAKFGSKLTILLAVWP